MLFRSVWRASHWFRLSLILEILGIDLSSGEPTSNLALVSARQAISASVGSQSVFIGLMAPDIVSMISFSWTSTTLQCVEFFQAGQQGSAVEWHNTSPVSRSTLLALVPQV